MKKGLSLIVTCYNEGYILSDFYYRIKKKLTSINIPYELIFVDDGSSDPTKEIVKNLSKSDKHIVCIFHKKNIGRGGSVTDGIYLSKYEFVGFLDVDLEISESYIDLFINELQNGSDLVIAQRKYFVRLKSLHRFIISKCYIFLVRFLLGLPFKDTEAGFKFFKKSRILPILKKVKDKKWFWDTEIVVRSYFMDLKISEIPVIFIRRSDKKSAVKILDDSIYYFKKLILFKKELRLPYSLFWEVLSLYSDSLKGITSFFLKWFMFPFKEIEKILPKKGLIIDLGCSEGILSNILAMTSSNRRVLGIDMSSLRLAIAYKTVGKRANIKFIKKNVLDFNFPRANGIAMSDFLHHLTIENQDKVLKKSYEALKKNGILVIKEVDKDSQIRHMMSKFFDEILYPNEEKCNFRGLKEWRGKLAKLGFKVTSKNAMVFSPFSTILLVAEKI